MVIGDDRDAFLVVAHQGADDRAAVVGVEGDAVAERELQHRRMRPHVLKKAQALDDPPRRSTGSVAAAERSATTPA